MGRYCCGCVLALVFVLIYDAYSQNACQTTGMFGPSCQDTCHCWDITGAQTCTRSDGHCGTSGCASGWSGHSCQRENVALARNTLQSTTYKTTVNRQMVNYYSSLAVDGDPKPDFYYGSCSRTANYVKENWWTVDLNQTRRISFVEIFGVRELADVMQRQNIGVYVSNYSFAGQSPHILCKRQQHVGVVTPIKCDTPITGRFVTIATNPTTTDVVTLCEVNIYLCTDGWYGDACEQRCSSNCRTCDMTTGQCLVCRMGLYGLQCSTPCGANCASPDCHLTTGICLYGCKDGWEGVTCNIACAPGLYGSRCSHSCSSHCLNGQCHPASGSCTLGCLPGWQGLQCSQVCEAGFFGPDCMLICGHCAHGTACHYFNGTCPSGCQPGWQQHNCSKVLPGPAGGSFNHFTTGVVPAPDTDIPMADVDHNNSRNLETRGAERSTGSSLPPYILGIIGAVIAVILIFVAIIIAIICYRRRRRLNQRRGIDNDTSTNTLVSLTETPSINSTMYGHDKRLPLKKDTELYAISKNLTSNSNSGISIPDLVLSAGKTPHSTGKNGIKGNTEEAPTTQAMAIPNLRVRPQYYNMVVLEGGPAGIPLGDLWNYVTKQKSSGGLEDEYSKLPTGRQAPWTAAKLRENQPKNRYQDLFPYDHSRVMLDHLEGSDFSDYINASYIHGYKQERKYVATQGPTHAMAPDFWRMVWQVNCSKIVMLTNCFEDGKLKCDEYWPDSGMTEYGAIMVKLLDEEVLADFTVRTFQLNLSKTGSRKRVIKQFHFTAWPDHGVPQYPTSLVHFLNKVRTTIMPGKGAEVVHCSAGVGRTGTFIGLDYLIEEAEARGKVNVFLCVEAMRKQRVNMIQTPDQYDFLYDALLEGLVFSGTELSTSDFADKYGELCEANPMSGKSSIQEQFELLLFMSPSADDQDHRTCNAPENKARNRSATVLASEAFRPYLATPVDGTSNYINAIFCPSYRHRQAFIATQMPLPATVIDLWRLVYEQKVRTIVMLNSPYDADCGLYWPAENQRVQIGPFAIEAGKTVDNDLFTAHTLKVVYCKGCTSAVRHLQLFVSKFWPEHQQTPSTAYALIGLMNEVDRWHYKDNRSTATSLGTRPGPIVIHCMDGASKCGLYCVIYHILERLRIDSDVNIVQTVKHLRIYRPQFITSVDQFKFCHDAVQVYIDNFQHYPHFL